MHLTHLIGCLDALVKHPKNVQFNDMYVDHRTFLQLNAPWTFHVTFQGMWSCGLTLFLYCPTILLSCLHGALWNAP